MLCKHCKYQKIYDYKDFCKNEILIFILILVLSGTISTLFFYGNIDPDFFSFYYIGRGMLKGLSLYQDLADNKGPVLYFFFAMLNFIFGNNYRAALFFASTLLDTITIYYSVRLVYKWINKKIQPRKFLLIFLILFFTVFYKSFEIDIYQESYGGIYAETLAMSFLVLSLFSLECKKTYVSGLFFALSVLSRQSVVFFIFLFIVRGFFKYKKLKIVLEMFVGTVIGLTLVIGVYVLLGGSLSSMYSTVIAFNLNYAKAIKHEYFHSLIFILESETRILWGIVVSIILSFYAIFRRKDKAVSIFVFTLFVVSFLSTFYSGMIHPHYLAQLCLLFIVVLFCTFHDKRWITLAIVIVLSYSLFFSYRNYMTATKDEKSGINSHVLNTIKIKNKEYLRIITYYPRYYLDSEKLSPDRYFTPYFLSERFNDRSSEERESHLLNMTDKAKNTLFVSVVKNEFDEKTSQEYLNFFGNSLSLKEVDVYHEGDNYVKIYTSSLSFTRPVAK